ncbi:MAG TPA: molybdopterin-guanine dinucleotide biosynthesis protein B [Gemmatimonadaceae bacterium]|jgi:molybdopterin-guanine dinucleotide biosynthesis protein B|nr:molybdopterin-guanine dinucleotide biosynthesis protein B [Gemmatimonadaceae bacterium]
MPRPPMVAVVGKKHSGKTTLTVRLAAELGRRGHRVMTIKHGSHTFNIDPATTDTYRHYHEGGAAKVAMVSPDKFALIERWSDELTAEEVATRFMSDADVVVCEGFTRSGLPKIEIFRGETHAAPLYDPSAPESSTYLAIVTDRPDFGARCPVFSLGDEGWLGSVVDLVEREIMGRS